MISQKRKPYTRQQGKDGVITDEQADYLVSKHEEKLERMKKSRGWDEGLDTESEDDEDYFINVETMKQSGFIWSLIWTILSMGTLPIWIVFWLIFGNSIRPSYWNFYCSSRKMFFIILFSNVLNIVLIFYLSYYNLCMEWPNHPEIPTLNTLNSCFQDTILNQWKRQCLKCFQNPKMLGCMEIGMSILLLMSLLWCFFHFQYKIYKWMLIGMMLIHIKSLITPSLFSSFSSKSIQIYDIDPNYAMINEPIKIHIEGQNLPESGILYWIPYWRCYQKDLLNVSNCPSIVQSQIQNGLIFVEFHELDQFLPCLTKKSDFQSESSSSSTSFNCFTSIRLRIKDKKSLPGWSLHESSISQSQETQRKKLKEDKERNHKATNDNQEKIPTSNSNSNQDKKNMKARVKTEL